MNAELTMNVAEIVLPSKYLRPRNPGLPLAPDWFEGVGVNASAVERRAATLTTRRSVKKEYQAAWLVKAMTCIDLTTLSGDDTPGRVRRLCAKARHPLGEELLVALDLADLGLTVHGHSGRVATDL
jgi:deoxyribose-phosphate aldolase